MPTQPSFTEPSQPMGRLTGWGVGEGGTSVGIDMDNTRALPSGSIETSEEAEKISYNSMGHTIRSKQNAVGLCSQMPDF